MKRHTPSIALVCVALAAGCTTRAAGSPDAGTDARVADANVPDAYEGDANWTVTRPRSTACIDVDIGTSIGEALGTTRVDALDDDVPTSMCASGLYRICDGILPAEHGIRWEVPETGFYELRARGTGVSYLALDIASFSGPDEVACRDATDLAPMVEPAFGETPLDAGWFCSCEYRPPTASDTWSTTPLRTTEALVAGSIVLLTVEATVMGAETELGVDIRRIESCDNGIDDDGDSDVDCRDSDCPFSNYGVPSTVCDERALCAMSGPDVMCCANGLDDDDDGETDCVDQQCSGSETCAPEFDCENGVDDDADLHTDCEDFDCRFASPCYDHDGAGESSCADGLDDDDDGVIDCLDSDCVYPGSDCFGVYEVAHAGECDDGYDNDGDGRVDCADVDCRRDSATCLDVETSCVGGVDEDLDDLVDCADPDCRAAAACVETECNDGTDNDRDTRTDCADSDCLCYGDCPCS